MKVTQFSGDGKTQKSVELSELIESMKTDGKGNPVSRLRQQIKESIQDPVMRADSTSCYYLCNHLSESQRTDTVFRLQRIDTVGSKPTDEQR